MMVGECIYLKKSTYNYLRKVFVIKLVSPGVLQGTILTPLLFIIPMIYGLPMLLLLT